MISVISDNKLLKKIDHAVKEAAVLENLCVNGVI